MYSREVHEHIFANGSTTFHKSTQFFPEETRQDVSVLYAFVRVADDFVDQVPQDKAGFHIFKKKYYSALEGKKSNDLVIDSFLELSKRKKFDPRWTDAFFSSMEQDLEGKEYKVFTDTLKYIYGSAEVIGMFMSRIMGLPEKADCYSALLGRSYQLINFIRDISEDLELNRTYFPKQTLELFELKSLEYEEVKSKKYEFECFIRSEIDRFKMYLYQAHIGLKYMPFDYALPIQTASDMFIWTADRIYKDPMVVYRKKVKPSKYTVLLKGFLNSKTMDNAIYLPLD